MTNRPRLWPLVIVAGMALGFALLGWLVTLLT